MALRLLLLAGAIGASILGLSGCGYVSAGPTDTEDRPVPGDLSAVVLESTGTLNVQPGEAALTITAGSNALDRITAAEQDGALHLSVNGGFLNSPGPIEYALTLPELTDVTVDGSGEVFASAAPTESLTVQVSGAGDVLITDVDAERVTVLIDGAGSVRLRGTVDHVEVLLRDAGDFHGDDLRARTAVADIDGSGEIEIHATDTLEASISGTGTIRHSGGAEVTENIDGQGEVTSG